jgi:uncharacterized OsmC-like protein
MKPEELRALQAPLKAKYKENPATAMGTLRVRGSLADNLTCVVDTWKGPVQAGLHPATGGDGSSACSGDMLLEALVACAGVTLNAVATAMSIPLRGGAITAEGDLDWRGTLGVSRDVPIGFKEIRLNFDLDTDAPAEQVQKLLDLTHRYCVIFQTLQKPPQLRAVSTLRGRS